MWNYPNLDPVALDFGVIVIHWYAISYLVGIGLVWWTVIIRNKIYGHGWTNETISDLVTSVSYTHLTLPTSDLV